MKNVAIISYNFYLFLFNFVILDDILLARKFLGLLHLINQKKTVWLSGDICGTAVSGVQKLLS